MSNTIGNLMLLLQTHHGLCCLYLLADGLPTGFTMSEQRPEITREQVEAEMENLFLPYRGFCARKGVNTILLVVKVLSPYM